MESAIGLGFAESILKYAETSKFMTVQKKNSHPRAACCYLSESLGQSLDKFLDWSPV